MTRTLDEKGHAIVFFSFTPMMPSRSELLTTGLFVNMTNPGASSRFIRHRLITPFHWTGPLFVTTKGTEKGSERERSSGCGSTDTRGKNVRNAEATPMKVIKPAMNLRDVVLNDLGSAS